MLHQHFPLLITLKQVLKPYWHALQALYQQVRAKSREARIAQTAGSLTFTTLLSLVPLLTIMLMLMSRISQFGQLGESLRNFLLNNLLPERAGKVIATYALQFSEKASNLTLLGTAMLLVTAVMLLQTIDNTLNSIWAIRRPRPWWLRIPTYWIVLTLGPFVLAEGITLSAKLLNHSLTLVDEPGWLSQSSRALLPLLLLAGLFSYLFHKVPNRVLDYRHSLIGGLAAALGVMLVQKLFGLYLTRLPNFTLIYGTFSVVPIFLVWLYFTWIAVLTGAVIAAVLPDFAMRRNTLPDTPQGRIQAALHLILALAAGQQRGVALSLQQLASESRQPHPVTEQLLDDLQQAQWVLRTEEGHWMLARSAAHLTLGEVMARLSLGSLKSDTPQNDTEQLIHAAMTRLHQALDEPIAHLLPQVLAAKKP